MLTAKNIDSAAAGILWVPAIYQLMPKNRLLRSLNITSTARAWKLSEVTAWVESCERGGKR